MKDRESHLLEETYLQINEDKLQFYAKAAANVGPGMYPALLKQMKDHAIELRQEGDKIRNKVSQLQDLIDEIEGKLQ